MIDTPCTRWKVWRDMREAATRTMHGATLSRKAIITACAEARKFVATSSSNIHIGIRRIVRDTSRADTMTCISISVGVSASASRTGEASAYHVKGWLPPRRSRTRRPPMRAAGRGIADRTCACIDRMWCV